MRLRSIIGVGVIRVALATLVAGALAPGVVHAQDDSGGSMGSPNGTQPGGMDSNSGANSVNSDMPASDASMPAPMAKMHMRQPITGSMMAAPPYGLAPMKVGFFVLADDPEGIGFLTYSWNFGDGTVSALPPELYIFHTYQNAGTYACSLTVTTVDGRSQTFRQGVVVKAPGD